MYHCISQAVTPTLPLANVIENWTGISKKLCEHKRERVRQLEKFCLS